MAKSESQQTILRTIGGALILIAVILIVWFLMRGQTTVNGAFEESTTTVALSCETNTYLYPFASYNNADSENIKAIITFESGTMNNISLNIKIGYTSEEFAEAGQSNISGNLSYDLNSNGFNLGALAENYSRDGKNVTTTLFAKKSALTDQKLKKYLLIENIASLNSSMDIYRKNFEGLGFICKDNN